ncbi:MAG: hypothetical protein KGL39_38000 [Patescibacteria group bacterium]|nr:hypothetical protein [Patescibacteria group bacterium]
MTLFDVYTRTDEIQKLTTALQSDNWESSADLSVQAQRLASIAEIAAELEPIYLDLATVLSDED